MNREIKFRAWSKDKDYLKMFYQDKQDSKGYDYLAIWLKYPNDYDVMQYTGLKDKNGKEIYEGDILAGGNGGEVYYNDELASFLLRNYHAGGLPIDMGGEIIGNIYENPELK